MGAYNSLRRLVREGASTHLSFELIFLRLREALFS